MNTSSPRPARLRALVAVLAAASVVGSVLVGAPDPARAADTTGTIHGSISFDGAPAPAAGSIVVTLTEVNRGWTKTVRADAAGDWTARGLQMTSASGLYKVGYEDTSRVFAPVWWNGAGAVDPWALSYGAAWPVRVTPEDPDATADVDLPAGAFLSGRVVRATPAAPPAPGTVPPLRVREFTVSYDTYFRAYPEGPDSPYYSFQRDTADDGTFTLGPLPPVGYRIAAQGGFVGGDRSDPNRPVVLHLAPGEHRDTGTTTTWARAAITAKTACASCDDVEFDLVSAAGTRIPPSSFQAASGAIWSVLPDTVHLEANRRGADGRTTRFWSGPGVTVVEGQPVAIPAEYGGTKAGDLVKTPGSPVVRVVVGDERFVPLASFGPAVDVGLGRSVRTVSSEAFFETRSGEEPTPPLTQRIDCGDETFFAGSGAAWPVARSLVAGLPATVLRADDALCSALPRGTGSTTRALFVKSASDPMIWQLDAAGAKHAVKSLSTVTQLSAPGEARWLVVDPGFLSSRPTGSDVLPAGSLVKTASSPRVFFSDGQGGLVPVVSFGQISAMGLPTTFTTVPDSVVAASTVASAPLTAVVRCGSRSYVAGSQTLTPVAAELVAGLTVTVLPEPTCAALPRAASGLDTALFVKTAGSPAVWLVDSTGAKRAVSAMSTVTQRSAPAAARWLVVEDGFVAGLRVGAEVLPAGALVKGASSPVVYWADGAEGLVPLPSFAVAADWGSTSWRVVPDAVVAGSTIAAGPLTNVVRCGTAADAPALLAGSGAFWPVSPRLVAGLPSTTVPSSTCAVLPRAAGSFDAGVVVGTRTSPVLWSIDARGTKRALLDMRSVAQLGGGRWAVVDAGFVSSLPTGADVLPPASLVKTASGPAVFLSDGLGGLVHLASFDTASDLGIPLALRTVADEVVSGSTIAAAPLAQVLRCGAGGELALGGSGGLSRVPAALVAGLPVTELPASTCAVLPRTTPMNRALLVKSRVDPVIWSVDAGGVKHAVRDGAALARTTSPDAPVWVTVSTGFLQSRPTGAPVV